MTRTCPECLRVVYSSNLKNCGFCGAKLPANLFSESYVEPSEMPVDSLPPRFQSRRKQLDLLKKADKKVAVFGVKKHGFRSRIVTEEELSEFEASCGVKLPTSYREHLRYIGYGVGPYYGIKSLDGSRFELEAASVDFEEMYEVKGGFSPAKPFPYSVADAQKIRAKQDAGEKKTWIKSTWLVDGCIPICHQGCTCWTVLVVTGESAGLVWNGNEDGGTWLPSWRSGGLLLAKDKHPVLPQISCPPTFDEWFDGWVEQALADLASQTEGERKNP